MKSLFVFSLIFFSHISPSFAWGKEGHAIVAEIAFKNMTPRAVQKVRHVLERTSIEDAANWMDEVRSDHQYDNMKPWHYINVEKGDTYQPTAGANLINAIHATYDELMGHKFGSNAEKQDLMKLMHLIGDLTQPLHVGYGSDRGGNLVQVTFNGRPTNLHHVWDMEIIQDQNISAESCYAVVEHFTPEQISTILGASIERLMDVSRKSLVDVYDFKGDVLPPDYAKKNKIHLSLQLVYAGLKLASMLDSIYNNEVRGTIGQAPMKDFR